MNPALSIVLPCYNESGNLRQIFARFRAVLGTRTDVEVLFVNNGSTDDSAAVLLHEMKDPENAAFARLVHVPVNQGYGFGIMAGVREAGGEIIAWTHADMQTDPADVLEAHRRFISQPCQERCFLKGRRLHRPFFDRVFTFAMSGVSSLVLGQWLSDVNAQPKMFHRSFVQRMGAAPDDFSLDLFVYYLAKLHRFTILEYPVLFGARVHGEAKGGGSLRGKIKLTRRTWAYIFRLRKTLWLIQSQQKG